MGSICQNLQTVKKVLRTKRKKQKLWINPASWNKVEERKQLKVKISSTKSNRIKQLAQNEYRDKDKELKKSMRKDERELIDNLVSDVRRAAENGQIKSLYEITKTLCNDKPRNAASVKEKNKEM